MRAAPAVTHYLAIRPFNRMCPCLRHHPELAYSNMCWGIYCQGLGIDVLSALAFNIFCCPLRSSERSATQSQAEPSWSDACESKSVVLKVEGGPFPLQHN